MKTEIIYGAHPVREALLAGRRRVLTVYVGKDQAKNRREEIAALAESQRIRVERPAMEALRTLARTPHHQGVCARVSPIPLLDVERFIATNSGDDTLSLLLVADCVVDPHNLGALIRTALATGVQCVITPRDRSAPPSAAVSKASAGALEHMPLARTTNLSRTLDALKKRGFWVFGLDRTAGQTIYQADLTGPLALVVGGEERGIRPLVKTRCDVLVSIPQQGPLDSLNASVAGAVAMYEVLRQRQWGITKS